MKSHKRDDRNSDPPSHRLIHGESVRVRTLTNNPTACRCAALGEAQSPYDKHTAFNKKSAFRRMSGEAIAARLPDHFTGTPGKAPTAPIFICTVAFRHYRQGRSHISVAGAYNSMVRSMKKVELALAQVVAGLSLGGCFVGKVKAPAPVVTKG